MPSILTKSEKQMRNITRSLTGAIAAAGLVFSISAQAVDITGAGATFPYPIYSKWAEAYNAKTGVKMNYQSIALAAVSSRSRTRQSISAHPTSH